MRILIISLNGSVIEEVPLVKARTTLGRRLYNDIVMDTLTVSGEHAVFHLAGNDVQLEDLNSTNGTYINARAIQKRLLGPGDLVEIGEYRMRCISRDDPPVTDASIPLRGAEMSRSGPSDRSGDTVFSLSGGTPRVSLFRRLRTAG